MFKYHGCPLNLYIWIDRLQKSLFLHMRVKAVGDLNADRSGRSLNFDGKEEEFYIRVGPGSRRLSTSEVVAYVTKRRTDL